MKFKKSKGHDMVLKRHFALEESCSGNDLDKSFPLKSCLRRGMKINMSMIFVEPKILQSSCPRCNTSVDVAEGVTTQW